MDEKIEEKLLIWMNTVDEVSILLFHVFVLEPAILQAFIGYFSDYALEFAVFLVYLLEHGFLILLALGNDFFEAGQVLGIVWRDGLLILLLFDTDCKHLLNPPFNYKRVLSMFFLDV